MNREEIIRMAREAGVFEVSYPHPAGNMVEVERFAALVAAAEREACAKAAENYADFQLQLGDDLAQWRAIGALAVMAIISEERQE